MNELQKKLAKDAGKHFAFIIISAAVLYMLSGGSINTATFTEAAIIEKLFYILFGIVIVYYLAMLIKVGVKYSKAGEQLTQIIKQPAQQLMEVDNPKGIDEVIDYSEPERSVFERFGGESFALNASIGDGMIVSQLKEKIESFYDNLDSLSLAELEQQYQEMEGIRKSVNKDVGELYEQYKKLEQQMQLTLGMIRTKKMMTDRIKQLRGK